MISTMSADLARMLGGIPTNATQPMFPFMLIVTDQGNSLWQTIPGAHVR